MCENELDLSGPVQLVEIYSNGAHSEDREKSGGSVMGTPCEHCGGVPALEPGIDQGLGNPGSSPSKVAKTGRLATVGDGCSVAITGSALP
jgi:hypothetical protein